MLNLLKKWDPLKGNGLPTFKLTLSVFGNYHDLIVQSKPLPKFICIITYPVSFDSD